MHASHRASSAVQALWLHAWHEREAEHRMKGISWIGKIDLGKEGSCPGNLVKRTEGLGRRCASGGSTLTSSTTSSSSSVVSSTSACKLNRDTAISRDA